MAAPAIPIVFACSTGRAYLPDRSSVPVVLGTHWHANDPVVQACPGMFSNDVRFGMFYTPGHEPPGYDAPIDERPVKTR